MTLPFSGGQRAFDTDVVSDRPFNQQGLVASSRMLAVSDINLEKNPPYAIESIDSKETPVLIPLYMVAPQQLSFFFQNKIGSLVGISVLPNRSGNGLVRFDPIYRGVEISNILHTQNYFPPMRVLHVEKIFSILYPKAFSHLSKKIAQDCPHLTGECLDVLLRRQIDSMMRAVHKKSIAPHLMRWIYTAYLPEKSHYTLHLQQRLAWRDRGILHRAAHNNLFRYIIVHGTLNTLLMQHVFLGTKTEKYEQSVFLKRVQSRLPQWQSFFEEAGKQYGIDWRLLAAISYQESHWKQDATSYTGVRGLMMLTQETAQYLGVKDREDPHQSIFAGGAYIFALLQKMSAYVPESDRLRFALASYNIGFMHLEDARILTERYKKNKNHWHDVKQFLPLLTYPEHHQTLQYGFARGKEAVAYVEGVLRYYRTLVWLDLVPESFEISGRVPSSTMSPASRTHYLFFSK